MWIVHVVFALAGMFAALTMMRTTVFDPKVLQKIARDAIAKNGTVDDVVGDVVRAMQRT